MQVISEKEGLGMLVQQVDTPNKNINVIICSCG